MTHVHYWPKQFFSGNSFEVRFVSEYSILLLANHAHKKHSSRELSEARGSFPSFKTQTYTIVFKLQTENQFQNRMTMRLLLLSILAVPGSFAYVASSSSPGAFTKPTFLSPPIEQTKTSRGANYDLGLGKNPPVSGKNKSFQRTDTYEAAQYWMVPEGVNNYPSPLLKPDEPKKKKPPPIVLQRLSQDAVDISGDRDSATAFLRVNRVDLEVNTLWVEMLIHDQQNMLGLVAV